MELSFGEAVVLCVKTFHGRSASRIKDEPRPKSNRKVGWRGGLSGHAHSKDPEGRGPFSGCPLNTLVPINGSFLRPPLLTRRRCGTWCLKRIDRDRKSVVEGKRVD